MGPKIGNLRRIKNGTAARGGRLHSPPQRKRTDGYARLMRSTAAATSA